MPWNPAKLDDGNVMPSIAYGTWRTGKGRQPVDSLKQAFSAGIRHVGESPSLLVQFPSPKFDGERLIWGSLLAIKDTAQNYTNEPEAGIAIRECGIPRKQIFVTTKWSGLDGLDIATSFKNSLKNLGLAYIDLYLIHGPHLCNDIPKCWKEMEKIKESGLAKSIGVSNFEVSHLEQVFSVAKYKPVVNQILLHPYVYKEQLPILEFCAKENIIIEAYSSLVPVTQRPGGPVDKPVGEIAGKLGASMDQVLLAWAKAKGTVPVTMSLKKERLVGYVRAGDLVLLPEHIKAIDEAGAASID